MEGLTWKEACAFGLSVLCLLRTTDCQIGHRGAKFNIDNHLLWDLIGQEFWFFLITPQLLSQWIRSGPNSKLNFLSFHFILLLRLGLALNSCSFCCSLLSNWGYRSVPLCLACFRSVLVSIPYFYCFEVGVSLYCPNWLWTQNLPSSPLK